MAPQYPNISSRRSRPRQARPVLRPSRERSDVTRRLGQQALRNAAGRYPQQREPHGGRSSSGNRHGGQQGGHGSGSQHSDGGSGLGQAAMSMLVGQLLEEVVDYVVRHNFFRRQKDSSSEDASKGTATATTARTAEQQQPQEQPHLQHSASQSSLEERQRRRRHRRSEVLMTSLDRLSAELETTYDALMRVSHAPPAAQAQVSSGDEPLIANVDELRRAITRSLARIESIRHHQRATRRGSRSARATRTGSIMTRAGSDAR